jgi:hypothetical protein
MNKKLINEDIKNMKYLLGYKPGRVISEQDIDEMGEGYRYDDVDEPNPDDVEDDFDNDSSFDAIYKYFDEYYDLGEIKQRYAREFDDGYYYDDENVLIFYTGKWKGENNSDIKFWYFLPGWFFGKEQEKAPGLYLSNASTEELNNRYFNYWLEPMKKWFQDKFKLPVKTVNNITDENMFKHGLN